MDHNVLEIAAVVILVVIGALIYRSKSNKE